jgi:hypothetical protein
VVSKQQNNNKNHGFQLGLSSWHIAVGSLQIAHVRMTSIRAANVCGLIFTAHCHNFRLLPFSETAVLRT